MSVKASFRQKCSKLEHYLMITTLLKKTFYNRVTETVLTTFPTQVKLLQNDS